MANCELRFLFTIFRHGARSPVASVLDANGNDPFGEHWGNPGELTPVGERMHYMLGLRNRDNYGTYLPKRWDPTIFIRSSDYNRTMMSVQSQLQGMFEMRQGPKLNRIQRKTAFAINDYKGKLKTYQKKAARYAVRAGVQVFPVHLWTRSNLLFSFFYHPFHCKPYNGMLAENRKAPSVTGFFERYVKQYGDQLNKLTGKSKEDLQKDYMFTFSLMDAFISDLQDGRKLTKAKEAGLDFQAFNKTAYEFSEIDIFDNWNGDKEGFFARWTCTALFPEVLAWMEGRIAADKAGNKGYSGYKLPKMAIFSTHDVTVGSTLTCFNRAFGTPKYYTPYACDLFLELHSEGENWNVVIKYNGHHLAKIPHQEFHDKLSAQLMEPDHVLETCGYAKPVEHPKH